MPLQSETTFNVHLIAILTVKKLTYLRKLIKYGGTKEAEQTVTEQKSRTPRRPALIDELSKL